MGWVSVISAHEDMLRDWSFGRAQVFANFHPHRGDDGKWAVYTNANPPRMLGPGCGLALRVQA